MTGKGESWLFDHLFSEGLQKKVFNLTKKKEHTWKP